MFSSLFDLRLILARTFPFGFLELVQSCVPLSNEDIEKRTIVFFIRACSHIVHEENDVCNNAGSVLNSTCLGMLLSPYVETPREIACFRTYHYYTIHCTLTIFTNS